MHSRFKRGATLGMCTVLALVAGLLAATPANAVPPTAASNFNPTETLIGVAGITDLVLSDRFDGSVEEDGNDETEAHITSVASNDTTQAIYFICPPGTSPAPGAAFPPAGCVEIGRDTAGEPAPGGDTAFEFFWDIPVGSDVEGDRDFLAYHCRGNPTGQEPGLPGNCLLDRETGVYVDDGQTGNATSAGAIHEWCVDRGGAGTPCDTQRRPFGHHEVLPALGVGETLWVFARFSSDVTTGQICLDDTADASNPPNACVGIGTGPVPAAGAFGEVAIGFTGFFQAGDEMAFFISDATGGSGGCAGDTFDCLLDTHYAVVEALEQPEQTHLHNDENPPAPGDSTTATGDTACEDADRLKTGSVVTGGFTELVGCFFSQFGQIEGGTAGQKDPGFSLDLPATFEAPAGWSFEDVNPTPIAGECETVHDHDADGDNEHCHLSGSNATNANGTLTYDVWVDNAGSDDPAEIVFCHDAEQGTDPAVNPDHGCDDASAAEQDSVNKTAVGALNHNHLRQSSQVGGTPRCHVGAASVNAAATTTVALTGCAQDQFHNGAPDVPVIWRVGLIGAQDPANFVGTPEQETDVNGEADAVVTAPARAAGEVSNIFFCADVDLDGICDFEAAQFQINWTDAPGGPGPGPGPGGRTTVRGADICNKNRPTANLPELLIGDRGPNKICGFGGRDTLRGLGGKDDLRGGKGKDVHSGGPGQDNQRGGKGADSLRGGKHADTLKGGPGRDTARGGPGNDLCRAEITRGCEQ